MYISCMQITDAVDNNNSESNNVGGTAENVPNISLNDSENSKQSNHLVTNSNDTDIDNLENCALSNLEAVDKDE